MLRLGGRGQHTEARMGGRVLTRWLQFISFALLALTISPAVDAQRQERNNSPGANPQQAQVTPKKTRPATPEAAAEEAREDAATIRARERWFYEQREYPLGFIPRGARLRALERLDEMERQLRAKQPDAFLRAPFPISPTTWTPLGPQPAISTTTGVNSVAGRTSAIAVDPTDPNIVYVGGAQGGVWKSTNGGTNWTVLTDTQASLAIGAIAIDPTNTNIVYVGTGEQTNSVSSYYGAGILKSTDGGATWQHIPGPFLGPFSSTFSGGGARISSIAIRPGTSGPTTQLLAGVLIRAADTSLSGVYRSTDAGATWALVPTASGAAGSEVLFVSNTTAYAALGTSGSINDPENGIYKSTDGGATWSSLTLPLTAAQRANMGRVEIAVAPSQINTLYASIENFATDGLLAFLKTTDGGTTWTSFTVGAGQQIPDFCTPQCWYDHVIKVYPTDANIVFAGGSAINGTMFRIDTTAGVVATNVAVGANGNRLHVDQQAMAIVSTGASSARIYAGNDGGIWRADPANSTDPPNWTNLNANLGVMQFYPGHSIDPSTVDIGIGGTQDNGTQKYTGALLWQEITCGDGGFTAIDPVAPTTYYATCQFIDIRKSTNSGSSFFGVDAGIPTERGAFIPPLIIDTNPGMNQRLYFGTFRIWQTMDGATTWTAISPDLTAGTGTIRTIAIAPGNSDIVYAGTSDGRIQRTINAGAGAGASWSNLTTTDLPPRLVTSVAVDFVDPANTAYATFSGFSGSGPNFLDTKGHVFKTTNAGASWTDISGVGGGALPNIPANDIAVDPDVPGTLYVGTDVGVFVTSDGGINWAPLMTGLPRVAVLGLKMHRATRILRAGTHGRGMWDLQLANFVATFNLASMSPTAVAVGSGAFTLTVNGVGFTNLSEVRWNGSARTTTFVNATQLTAQISAADVATGAFVQVNVFDPGQPAPGTTNTLPFSVTNPTPTLTSISPTQAVDGGPAFTLTANGANFLGPVGGTPVTQVRWNGSARTTSATLVTSSQITVQIPASDIATPGVAAVTVFSPSPGGGSSNVQTLTVGTPPANDNFANEIVIAASPFTDTRNNAAAGNEVGEPGAPCALATGSPGNFHSIWYRHTPATNGTATIDTIGSGVVDTVLSVWTGNAVNALTSVACDDDSAGNFKSRVTLSMTAGTTYHIMLSGYSATDGGATTLNFAVPITFTMGANPTTITVNRGGSGTATITVTPQGGAFAGAVTFFCTGLPSQSACSFNPISVTPGANPATTMLTITTTAPSMIIREPSRWPALPPIVVLLLSLIAALVLVVGLAGKRSAQWRVACCLCAVMILAGLGVACGGGGGGPPPPPPNPGTPPGTYTVTVTGSSGATTATTQVTLQVN